MTAFIVTWLLTRSVHVEAPAVAHRVTYTVERRPFKAVVTLDGNVIATAPVPVSRLRRAADVQWSVKNGDVVKAGQIVGAELPSASEAGSGQPGGGATDLAHAKRQLVRLRKTIQLDIADAEDAVRSAPAAGRSAAQRSLTRTRLNAQQSIDDLEQQIAALRRSGSTQDGRRTNLTAPVAGAMTILTDGTAATVQPDGYLISAPVDPLMLYRLTDRSGRPISHQNTVRLTGLGTEFACTQLQLQDNVPASAARDPGDAGANSTPSTTTASCHVPPEVRVFTGLKVTLALTVADIPDALILDAAGIRSKNDDQGIVSILGSDGRVESRTIDIGQTDGLSVVVESGLQAGDRIVDPSSD